MAEFRDQKAITARIYGTDGESRGWMQYCLPAATPSITRLALRPATSTGADRPETALLWLIRTEAPAWSSVNLPSIQPRKRPVIMIM